jgi:hypothetical protein
LQIFDHALVVKQRQVIHPGSPETSELIDLVQGGSMPPGTCPKVPEKEVELLKEWIRHGAKALPGTHDESYVLWSIVCDLRTMTDEQKRSIRYLSLNHLLGQESKIRNLAQQREILERVLRELVPDGKQTPNLRPIDVDSTKTIFRIDLKDLGWDRQPYPCAEKQGLHLNLFDLILLEYPHSRLPTDSPFYRDGLRQFLLELQEAGQVRPIVYVRGDWLAAVFAQPRSVLNQDFLRVLGKSANKRSQKGATQPDPLEAIEIAAAGNGGGSLAGKALGRNVPSIAMTERNIRVDEGKKQHVFHDALLVELLDRESKRGVPIVPLDGLTYSPTVNTDIEFKAIDFKHRKRANPPAKNVFEDGDGMALWLQTKWDPVYEMIDTDKKGHKTIYPLKQKSGEGESGMTGLISPKDFPMPMVLEKDEEQYVEEYTLFVYPMDVLKGMDADFPKGTLLRAEGIHDRVVHPFYQLRDDGQVKPPDPSKMVKVTLLLTTCRPKSK